MFTLGNKSLDTVLVYKLIVQLWLSVYDQIDLYNNMVVTKLVEANFYLFNTLKDF